MDEVFERCRCSSGIHPSLKCIVHISHILETRNNETNVSTHRSLNENPMSSLIDIVIFCKAVGVHTKKRRKEWEVTCVF